MSKYRDLEARINMLDNGWTKEADDILFEIRKGNTKAYQIGIVRFGGKFNSSELTGDIRIYIESKSLYEPDIDFSFTSQCEKNEAFKKALMWLLDHSDIKGNNNKEEIQTIKDEIKELQRKIKHIERD